MGIPRKIAIIGLPGSGKSTFATKLGKVLNVPVHHLDRHMFEEGGKKRDKQEFLEIQKAMAGEKAWVIEGCSISTLGTRFAKADTVIYFKFPCLLCIWRTLKRLFFYDKTLSETGCLRGINWKLLKYIWTFEQEKGPSIEKAKKQYPNAEFQVFKNSDEAKKFLKAIPSIHE